MKIFTTILILFFTLNLFSQIIYYPDRNTFLANCSSATLVLEDFEGGPTSSGNSGCDGDFSAAGNSCFPAGEIQPGIVITSSDNNSADNPMAFTQTDFAGNPTPVVGTNQFPDYTIVNFPDGDINAVALDLYGLPFADTMHIRLFSATEMVDELTITEDLPGPAFFGFIATEPIVSIEFQADGSSVEMVGMVQFGSCDVSSVNGLTNFNFQYYPNPATNNLTLKANNNIDFVSINNILGQEIKKIQPFKNDVDINITDLQPGTYFTKVKINNKVGVFKFLKY